MKRLLAGLLLAACPFLAHADLIFNKLYSYNPTTNTDTVGTWCNTTGQIKGSIWAGRYSCGRNCIHQTTFSTPATLLDANGNVVATFTLGNDEFQNTALLQVPNACYRVKVNLNVIGPFTIEMAE